MTAYRRGRLVPAIYLRMKPWLAGFKYLFYNPARGRVSLHLPARVQPDPRERPVVERIFRAFKAMKDVEATWPSWSAPSSVWRAQLDEAYEPLTTAWRQDDLERFHRFLANFGVWERYLGLDSRLIRQCRASWITRRYLQNDLLDKPVRFWRRYYDNRKPVTSLRQPTYGNQAGGQIGGVFVGFGACFDEIHGTLISGLLAGHPHPVVAEVGAGYGRFAYFILRGLRAFTYIDFDLPETLCLAAYYFMLSFPEKRVLLYGEGPYGPEAHRAYEAIFMPSSELCRVGRESVDIFLNKNSLGEMSPETVRRYIAWMTAATRRYLFHMNHDTTRNLFEGGSAGLLGYEYPIPRETFHLLFRYPDVSHLMGQGWLDRHADIVLYLYERGQDIGGTVSEPSTVGDAFGSNAHD